MMAAFEITAWHYAGFVGAILIFLALDLGVFHKKAHVVSFKEAMGWTTLWVSLAGVFAFAWVRPKLGHDSALLFISGYLTELSLSMDNVFVIALIFTYFKVPTPYQHRVLFWGILGALIMRGVMIWAGVELIRHFHWSLYFFGAFLVFTGIKMLFADEDGVHPDSNPAVQLVRRFFPVSPDFDGAKFTTLTSTGKRVLTPLAVVLIMVESTDLVFAVDSIPAIFGLTTDPFIVFTSNAFAILGLRSLYFVLAGAIAYFKYLKIGLSLVLVFIGVKMLIAPHGGKEAGAKKLWFQIEISSALSLSIVAGILILAILGSVVAARIRPSGSRPSPDDTQS
ncbi:MAG: TerC family protein [Verrucomicrobia bacterium]|nr:TerC family protein [Verrucomicrobiota bacterium]